MAETIASRVSRIIVGSAHALLDKAENLAPEAVMSQSIREIDQVIAEVRVDLGKAEAAKHLVLSRIAKLNAEHETLGAQLDTAVAENRDDLAGAAIARQTDIEDLLPVLQKALDEQSEQSAELESYVVALLAKKRELEQVQTDYLATLANQAATSLAPGLGDRQARIEDAAASFDRVLSRQTGASLLIGGGNGAAGKLKELAEMQRNNRIAERLAAAKAAFNGK
ncbi:PspA/IM30 family protein [Quatrionicoccus australiensis]|uniref:PspA/IM30 family protein n=1 Tax=Quatrionicoccus australiensis TaxID=138118 RepID=UPI001CFBEB5D|nr:PspA/IM30 family protein [Quatrionicoccus australiensis]MCB4358199.1 PspA/IM30 family protein [Quatrionicoccus australiensis]